VLDARFVRDGGLQMQRRRLGSKARLTLVVLGGTGMGWARVCSCKQLPVGGRWGVEEGSRGGEWMGPREPYEGRET
jgi:hypothetical protein